MLLPVRQFRNYDYVVIYYYRTGTIPIYTSSIIIPVLHDDGPAAQFSQPTSNAYDVMISYTVPVN